MRQAAWRMFAGFLPRSQHRVFISLAFHKRFARNKKQQVPTGGGAWGIEKDGQETDSTEVLPTTVERVGNRALHSAL